MISIVEKDPLLQPFSDIITQRQEYACKLIRDFSIDDSKLSNGFNSHLYYGLHITKDEWVFREWAPNASAIYFLCDDNNWQPHADYKLSSTENGNWEIHIKRDKLKHEDFYKILVEWDGGKGERLPSHVRRVVQDNYTKDFVAQVWNPEPYIWKNKSPKKQKTLLIYEAHIGMSTELQRVATFTEFRLYVLPRIADLGYNTIQLMAIQEHPYYGSFGYQVSNFFAVSSRFGTPEELKLLIDEAHGLGISVVLDIVHSHSVSNENEGLGFFDGTDYQYFHAGARGHHPLWKSRCFDYGKPHVMNFLLSNCKFWLEEFHFDGFRFDGVTSMLYLDHGIERAFTEYKNYYDGNQDEDAIAYLTLANNLIHEINPHAITIAEEVSGMPGLAFPFEEGGIGFDYRMQMGTPDYWIKLIEDQKDEQWHMGDLYYELTNKRDDEKSISYAESHDQALVGDKTIFFRLAKETIYNSMSVFEHSVIIERAMALHKMIRLITLSTAGNGYLTFMGNEWGHPEWIDFPREGNQWSYQHARRLWSLVDDKNLKFKYLNKFDKSMIHWASENDLLDSEPTILVRDNSRQILAFSRGEYLLIFNFSPNHSYTDYQFEVPAGKYTLTLNTDNPIFDGQNRIDESVKHFTQYKHNKNLISLYLPARTAMVFKRV